MSKNRTLFSLAMLTLCLGSVSADAQLIPNPFDNCHVCKQSRPIRVPVVRAIPPCDCLHTVLIPRQEVVYQDIPTTQYRQETITQQVPVTRFRNVTVDEGGYQTVWVPKVITKQIPETVYEPRIVSRMVPYQTVTRVPQVSTTYQPQTAIRPSAIGATPTRTLTPQIAIEPLPRTASVTPTSVTPAAPRGVTNPVQLEPNLTRNTSSSYDSQVTPQRAGKVSASSAAVFRRFQ
jgi:hypothetical protein